MELAEVTISAILYAEIDISCVNKLLSHFLSCILRSFGVIHHCQLSTFNGQLLKLYFQIFEI